MVCGKRVPAPLSVSGQEHYSVQQELIRKKGSHKQEHTGTQTWGTNDMEGVMRTKPGQTHRLMGAWESVRKFIPVRLSDRGP